MSVYEEKLTAIANAIRTKKGTTETIKANDFAEEILNLSDGEYDVESIINEDGSQNLVISDAGTIKPTPTPSVELPAYMSAKYFTFNGNICTGYTGDPDLPEIIIPKSYSIVGNNSTTVIGAKILDFYVFGINFNSSINFTQYMIVLSNKDGSIVKTYATSSQADEVLDDFDYYTNEENGIETEVYITTILKRNETDNWNPNDFGGMHASDISYPIICNNETYVDDNTFINMIFSLDPSVTTLDFTGELVTPIFGDGNDYQVTAVNGFTSISGQDTPTFITNGRIILLSNITEFSGGIRLSGCNQISLSDNIAQLPYYAFYKCQNLKSINIPQGVTTIPNSAFSNCTSLKEISIPNTVTAIGNNAFIRSRLKNLIIPDSVTSIGQSILAYASDLETVTISKNLTDLNSYTFRGTGLKSLNIPSNITALHGTIVIECLNLVKLTVDSENSKYYSKNNCILEKETNRLMAVCTTSIIPDDVTIIGPQVYYYSNFTTFTIPNNIVEIQGSAFGYCKKLISIIIPNTVTTLGTGVFANCDALESVNLSNNLTVIPASLFSFSKSLKEIIIPEKVTSIGTQAFWNCQALKTIKLEPTTPPTLASVNSISSSYVKTIYVPSASLNTYKTATNWSKFASKMVGY